MKTLLALLLALTATLHAQDPTQDELKNAKVVDLQALDEKPDVFLGKVIKVRFTSRGQRMDKDGPGVWVGDIMQYQTIRKKDSSWVTVRFPQEAFEWFRKVPLITDPSEKAIVVYARVIMPEGLTEYQLRLLGREAKIGMKGMELKW